MSLESISFQPGSGAQSAKTISETPSNLSRNVIFESETLRVETCRVDGGVSESGSGGATALAVLDGALTLRVGEEDWYLETGQVLVLPSDAYTLVTAAGPTRWFAITAFNGGETASGRPVLVDPCVAVSPTPQPAPEIMLSAMPDCAGATVFEDPVARFKVGVWRSTPYARKVMPHRVHEFMLLLEGSVVLTMGSGERREVRASEAVFIPKGMPCGWNSDVDVKKIYVVQDPP
ncbi:cupin domain-containing protein [Microvirga alba]|uniref:DUF861 domain-containing protein n=1 Tax=Microvirga alba TaxID=2791025 RepID=A0A931BPZ3_9HYPH|nr:cupin domain-containing protein [Microvirga alba]MBF9235321.1 DUF861 domain-containing protein [Microvirga alba]